MNYFKLNRKLLNKIVNNKIKQSTLIIFRNELSLELDLNKSIENSK